METEGRLTVYSAFKSIPPDPPFKFKEDTLPPLSSQEAPESPSSPSTDSWDVFITPLDDCFRKGNKKEGGRSHDSMRRTDECDSSEDTREATCRKEMLLQALQAVEVNFYRKSSLLLRYVA
ncbi:hypothetical protein TGRUB_288970 [Toxoplasma gondii RUB]|uniref:Uncharacterized protein n=11 Tax=Toxoplasma gondii TaxID=5811 RepID=B9PTU9_TOXGV|nr:hypothetical protein TGGT1_288970 [Toxoplasma gondii GT1]ESS33763.1 hypothetical protein TGVEG_288970 [Toxoplasma gondii VEG]KAF4644384.1 hypothetical protein TGRH88_013780 [Toxoplasma gondii]KFG32991.1 hypothetical protein TGP89_288970 [Toxoplasma gondii p89]KFG42726.1 hypothetical protein TGDOM2_288970 [Toxoplasma gondii GAB2-2007-GAL-DOM2]KFG53264.1 hypothetical protein TGFOU_288970 [Toxoplasma gondii FOU]KFG62618.1 hypothetical protein TGRUB_288970 [Toxoplasma gondii RUB]KFH08865.1 hy